MVVHTGAKYIIFTLNHQYPDCPAPIPEWEAMFPGKTTDRDLIQEIMQALKPKGIKFIMYNALCCDTLVFLTTFHISYFLFLRSFWFRGVRTDW